MRNCQMPTTNKQQHCQNRTLERGSQQSQTKKGSKISLTRQNDVVSRHTLKPPLKQEKTVFKGKFNVKSKLYAFENPSLSLWHYCLKRWSGRNYGQESVDNIRQSLPILVIFT